jgi:hypothetical protein
MKVLGLGVIFDSVKRIALITKRFSDFTKNATISVFRVNCVRGLNTS